jgi:hypothetical protein
MLQSEAVWPSSQVDFVFNALQLFNHAFCGKPRQCMKQQIYHTLSDILCSLKNIRELCIQYSTSCFACNIGLHAFQRSNLTLHSLLSWFSPWSHFPISLCAYSFQFLHIQKNIRISVFRSLSGTLGHRFIKVNHFVADGVQTPRRYFHSCLFLMTSFQQML